MPAKSEVAFRDVEKTPEIEALINRKIEHLDKICNNLISCRVVVEHEQKHQRHGNPYRVLVNMRVPPDHELVAKSKPRQHDMHQGLETVVNDTFHVAERRLRKQMEKMQGRVKKHEHREPTAFVNEIFKDAGYGFIHGLDGTQYYFHKNSVVGDDFDRLDRGMGVHFVPSMGEKGPQAKSVHVVETSGVPHE